MDVLEQHRKFYYEIRERIWPQISFEDQLPPTLDTLELHWLRSLWVFNYWEQTCSDKVHILPIELFGWKVNGEEVEVEWDSDESTKAVQDSLLPHKGCKCKTSCDNKRCRCVKKGDLCGPGCNCINCENKEKMGKSNYIKVLSAEFYFHKPITVHLELYLFYCFIHFLLYIGQY